MPIQSRSPATGFVDKDFEPFSPIQIEFCLALAHEQFTRHRLLSFAERARKMQTAANLLETEADSLARLMALEMGKPIRAGREEAKKCATVCRYYAEHAERFLADEVTPTQASRSWTRIEPLGPILAIMPWNFPLWQVFRFAAPALMAGNVGLLKHSSNVPQCALAIEDIFTRAGFAKGTFQTLLIESTSVASLIDDPRVVALTLTGSEAAGRAVAERAGRQLKKIVLELGGSDPFIVLPSADIALAATTAARSRTMNAGQSCISAKRFIVHQSVASDFERRFADALAALKVGDPLLEETDIGPLAMPKFRDELMSQLSATVALGAKVVLGGSPIAGPGCFFAPTLITQIPLNSPAAQEELFGPIASLFQVANFSEAIQVANSTRFGLGAAVWTHDESEQKLAIERLEAGSVFVNAMVASDPRLPFGGIKSSGHGRELGAAGIREFINLKTVWIA